MEQLCSSANIYLFLGLPPLKKRVSRMGDKMAHSEGSAQLVRLEGKVGDPPRLYKVGLAAPSSPEIRGLQIARFVQSPFLCIGIFRPTYLRLRLRPRRCSCAQPVRPAPVCPRHMGRGVLE